MSLHRVDTHSISAGLDVISCVTWDCPGIMRDIHIGPFTLQTLATSLEKHLDDVDKYRTYVNSADDKLEAWAINGGIDLQLDNVSTPSNSNDSEARTNFELSQPE